ncbi:hypothetical protein LguiA_027904 [Lonicera macranthoides]
MRSSSTGGLINISFSAQKVDVDNRISLRFYNRIAHNILKQADIFREEKNIIDLYIMLLRFSSLVSETIPRHRDYRASLQSDLSLKKKLLNALSELEKLKPAVKQKIDELNKKHAYQADGWAHPRQNNLVDSSLEWPSVQKKNMNNYALTKTTQPATREYVYYGPSTQQFSLAKPVEEQFRRFSLSIPRPTEETLSRHSILGPNGLHGQCQHPSTNIGVNYPSNVDLTPVEIPRERGLWQSIEDEVLTKKDCSNSELKRSSVESILSPKDDNQIHKAEEPGSLISFETIEIPLQANIIRQPSPPPVLADVQDLIPTPSPLTTETEYRAESSMSEGLVCSESSLELHIPTSVMKSFMNMAKSNTDKNLETCGILAGSLKKRKFYITALIIPKQESTSNTCQTTNEEEIFEVQDKQSLFPLGWIHTHPTQSCFMSSVDVHTHYSYQIMLPEAIAIVMAPRDSSRTHGIFRLTTPGGMGVIRHCPHRGFHSHDTPSDGGPIYDQCTDVYMNPNLKFDIIDLR